MTHPVGDSIADWLASRRNDDVRRVPLADPVQQVTSAQQVEDKEPDSQTAEEEEEEWIEDERVEGANGTERERERCTDEEAEEGAYPPRNVEQPEVGGMKGQVRYSSRRLRSSR